MWFSVDPAKGAAGVAVWDADELQKTLIIKARGSRGKFYCGEEILPSRHDAWMYLFDKYKPSIAVIEKGAGGRANIVDTQGWMRGCIETVGLIHGCPSEILNVSEWRRLIKETEKVAWPRDRDRKKSLAVQLVSHIFEIIVTDDEADAVLIGLAALRSGIVNINKQTGKKL